MTTRVARRHLGLEGLEARALLTLASASPVAQVGPISASEISSATSLPTFFVKFTPGTLGSQQAAALSLVRGTVSQTYPDGSELVREPNSAAVAAAVKTLSANPLVMYAQGNTVIKSEAAVVPNEATFPYSWGLNNSNDVDIDAPDAWGVTTGNFYTIVAVLDTGIDLTNQDFAGHIWTNPYNDAASGYPNDVHGWNFVANTNNVNDNNGHGTFVSSILGAVGNNTTGVAGVAWNVQIMPVKFLDSNGVGTTDRAVSAIYYAVNHGARVINASWGGIDFTQPLRDAITYANAHNTVFVTAAGNNGTNNDVTASYPASLRLPNELSVASVDINGNLPYFSNYGSQTVDLAAPGVSILGDYPTAFSATGTTVLSGTSMSTAYVSGVAALVASVHPEYTAAQIVQRIDATVKPLPALAGKVITGGIVDAYRAIGSTDSQVQAAILGSNEFYVHSGSTAQGFVTSLYVDLLNRSPDANGLAYWSNIVQTGAATRTQVAAAILGSNEAEATEVAGWYQTDLGRTTSIDTLKSDSGVQHWVSILNSGVSPENVEALLLSSSEYLNAHGSSPTPVVAAWYQNVMGRTADSGGAAVWANFLAAGQTPFSTLQAFQATSEAKTTRVARWFTRYLGRTASLSSLKADAGVQSLAAGLVPGLS